MQTVEPRETPPRQFRAERRTDFPFRRVGVEQHDDVVGIEPTHCRVGQHLIDSLGVLASEAKVGNLGVVIDVDADDHREGVGAPGCLAPGAAEALDDGARQAARLPRYVSISRHRWSG